MGSYCDPLPGPAFYLSSTRANCNIFIEPKMNNTSPANSSSKNASGSSVIVLWTKAEGIAWCSTFILASVFVVVGNSLTIALFAVNKKLHIKKSLFLVINMAFADLMLGALSMPGFIFHIGGSNFFQLWEGSMSMPLNTAHDIVDTFFMRASVIFAAMISGERFYAVYCIFKYQTLSMRTYHIAVFMSWTLALLDTALEIALVYLTKPEDGTYVWIPFALALTLIICGCNIGIWRTFQHGGVASRQQNRALQNKRLTNTLLFVSILALLSWLPLITMDALDVILDEPMPPDNFYLTVTLLNYSNSFLNPVVYAFRIPEFRQALYWCYDRRQAGHRQQTFKRESCKETRL